MALALSDSNDHHLQSPATEAERREREAFERRRRIRSIALAWALFALAVMFFLVTIVRLGGNVANRPF